jgi:UDP-N-acetylmuramyl tripeptide synthase
LDGSAFTVAINGKRSEVKFPLPGTYNLYNALAAISVGAGLGIAPAKMIDTLATASAAFGRVEKVEVEGRTLCLLLIKNPAGFTQVVETFLVQRTGLRVMMAVNDLDADGRDVSWLWDVPLEVLAPHQPLVVTAGIRGADMALRLHYAGVETEPAETFEEAVRRVLELTPKGETAYILPTYTAMLQVRNVLSKLTRIPEAGK